MEKIKIGCGDKDCERCKDIPEEMELPIRKAVSFINKKLFVSLHDYKKHIDLLSEWVDHVGLDGSKCEVEIEKPPFTMWTHIGIIYK